MTGSFDQINYRSLLSTLAEIQSELLDISPETEVTEVLTRIASGANTLLNGYFAVVEPYRGTLEKGRFLVEQFIAVGATVAEEFEWREPRPDGVANTVLRNGLLEINDLEDDVRSFAVKGTYKGGFRDFAEVRSAIGVRMEEAGEILGVLFIVYQEPRRFDETEILIARLFANQAGIALRTMRQVKQQELSMALQRIAKSLNEGISQNQILDRILANAEHVLSFDAANIMLIDEETGEIRIEKARNYAEPKIGKHYSPDHLRGLRRMYETKLPVLIEDTAHDPLWAKSEHNTKVRSYIGAPLVVRDQVRGFLNFDSWEPNRFVEEDVERVAAFAEQASVAWDNVESYKVLRRIQDAGRHLVTQAMRPNITLNQFLDDMINETHRLFRFDVAQVLLAEGNRLRAAAASREHPEALKVDFDQEHSLSGLAIRERKTVYVPNVDQSENSRLYKAPVSNLKMKSNLIVPLVVGDQAIGVYNIESVEEDSFDERERNMIGILCGHIALAIDLARSRAEAQTLTKVANELSAKTDTKDVIRSILDRALEIIKAEFGQVLIRDGQILSIQHVTSNFDQALGQSHEVESCNSGLAVIWKQPVIINNVDQPFFDVIPFDDAAEAYPRPERCRGERVLYRQPHLREGQQPMRSELVVPLMLDGDVIGVLNVESQVEGFFQVEHARQLRAFASQAAGALGRAQDIERMMNAQSSRIETETVRRFVTGLTHQLRSPSAGIRVDIDLINTMLKANTVNSPLESDALAKCLARIDRAAKQLVELPNTIIREGSKYEEQALTLTELISRAFEVLNQTSSRSFPVQKALRMVSYDDTIRIPDRIRADSATHLVIDNIITNAYEAIDRAQIADGKIQISAARRIAHNTIELYFTDNGPGVPDTLKNLIFEPGFSQRTRQSGGIGLWWVREHLRPLGAKIRVEDGFDGRGARFVLEFAIHRGDSK